MRQVGTGEACPPARPVHLTGGAFGLTQPAGAVVVGPVSSVRVALGKINGEAIDAAILDINLDRATSFPVAEKLRELRVPHAFMTGYDGWSLPEKYRSTARLTKPFDQRRVIDCMAALRDRVAEVNAPTTPPTIPVCA